MSMKTFWIIVAVVASMLLLFAGCGVGTNNTAIGYEESIYSSLSSIKVQKHRQVELIEKLVQVVEANAEFESGTQTEIVKLRGAYQSGNIAEAQLSIKVVSEAYPDLKTNAAFVQLMNELSVSENILSNYRTTYNEDLRGYNTFTRSFPNSFFLRTGGYEVMQFNYLDFSGDELPENLFPTK